MAAMGDTHGGSTGREQMLARLLTSLFDADELRTWVRFQLGEGVYDNLPGTSVSASALTLHVVVAIARRGVPGPALFDSLIERRPGRASEITSVAAMWLQPPDEATEHAMPTLADMTGPAITNTTRETPGHVHTHRLFAAYASPDAAVTEAALALIGTTGTVLVRSHKQVTPGDDMKRALSDEITRAASIAVFWSRDAARSESIAWQIQQAVAHRKRIIPVLLDDTTCCDELRDIQSIDLREHNPRRFLSEHPTFLLPWISGVASAVLPFGLLLVTTELGAGLHGLEAALYWSSILASSIGAGSLVYRVLTRRLTLGADGDGDGPPREGSFGAEAIAGSFRDQYLDLR
jgi:hypothetical protein